MQPAVQPFQPFQTFRGFGAAPVIVASQRGTFIGMASTVQTLPVIHLSRAVYVEHRCSTQDILDLATHGVPDGMAVWAVPGILSLAVSELVMALSKEAAAKFLQVEPDMLELD